jgi:hypothetical protein
LSRAFSCCVVSSLGCGDLRVLVERLGHEIRERNPSRWLRCRGQRQTENSDQESSKTHVFPPLSNSGQAHEGLP